MFQKTLEQDKQQTFEGICSLDVEQTQDFLSYIPVDLKGAL